MHGMWRKGRLHDVDVRLVYTGRGRAPNKGCGAEVVLGVSTFGPRAPGAHRGTHDASTRRTRDHPLAHRLSFRLAPAQHHSGNTGDAQTWALGRRRDCSYARIAPCESPSVCRIGFGDTWRDGPHVGVAVEAVYDGCFIVTLTSSQPSWLRHLSDTFNRY
jgi:hypothetical protein